MRSVCTRQGEASMQLWQVRAQGLPGTLLQEGYVYKTIEFSCFKYSSYEF